MLRRNVRLVVRATAAAMVLGAFAACGGGGHAPSGPTVGVAIADTTFTPSEVTIPVGGAVQWTNTSATERHNIIPTVVGSFKKHDALLKNGESVTIAFAKAGDYAYYCSLHGSPTAGQRGIVHVTAT